MRAAVAVGCENGSVLRFLKCERGSELFPRQWRNRLVAYGGEMLALYVESRE